MKQSQTYFITLLLTVILLGGCATGLETYRQPSKSLEYARIKEVHRSNLFGTILSGVTFLSIDGLLLRSSTVRITPGAHSLGVSAYIVNNGEWNAQAEVEFDFIPEMDYYFDARDRGSEVEILIRVGSRNGEIVTSIRALKNATAIENSVKN